MASLSTSEVAVQLPIDNTTNTCSGGKRATLANDSPPLRLPTEIKLKIVRYCVVFNNDKDNNTCELGRVRKC